MACPEKKARDTQELEQAATVGSIYHLRLNSWRSFYWVHIEMAGQKTLYDLDAFIRNLWVECCSHLSEFEINDQIYRVNLFAEWSEENSEIDDFEIEIEHTASNDDAFEFFSMDIESLFIKPSKVNIPIQHVLKQGTEFEYVYDFGSSTDLTGKVINVRQGPADTGIRILARNAPYNVLCEKCQKSRADAVCMYCFDALCPRCQRRHECEQSGETFLPLVNSPRVGVCGYTGDNQPYADPDESKFIPSA
ncbi:MAG: hypothetical protein Q9P14_01080 [candidate division KSB1 bacterium]|nr:hypothetical protein [candidate division KSB1 bacterium]